MQGIVWLWKHRHCWEELKQLYDGAPGMRSVLRKVSFARLDVGRRTKAERVELAEQSDNILLWLDYCGRGGKIPLVRPWKVSPPPAPPLPGDIGRIERALVLPTGGGENSFVAELDPAKEIKPWYASGKLRYRQPSWAIDAGCD